MTYTDELSPEEQLEDEGGGYPEAFGITFTPLVSGIILALLGVGIAVYLWMSFVGDAQQEYEDSKQRREDLVGKRNKLDKNLDEQTQKLQQELDQLEADLAQIRSQQEQVFSLLSSEDSLDTLLFDLEQIVQEIKGASSSNELELQRFEPNMPQIKTVNDSSFGSDANGKIRHRTYDVEVVGTFAETQLLIKRLEELEPLLVVNNFETQVTNEQLGEFSDEDNRFIVSNTPTLESSFELEAVLPDEKKLRKFEKEGGDNNNGDNGKNNNGDN